MTHDPVDIEDPRGVQVPSVLPPLPCPLLDPLSPGFDCSERDGIDEVRYDGRRGARSNGGHVSMVSSPQSTTYGHVSGDGTLARPRIVSAFRPISFADSRRGWRPMASPPAACLLCSCLKCYLRSPENRL